MNTRINIAGMLLILLLMQCHSSTNKSADRKKSADTDIANWAKDKNGCLGLRNNDLATKLVKEYHLTNNTREEFLKIFNSPDRIDTLDGAETLIYYWGNICTAGKIDEADKCYAKFHFKTNKLGSIDFPCE